MKEKMTNEKAIELMILAKGRFLDSPEKYEAIQIGIETVKKDF